MFILISASEDGSVDLIKAFNTYDEASLARLDAIEEQEDDSYDFYIDRLDAPE